MEWFARVQPLTNSVGMLCLIVAIVLSQASGAGTLVEVVTGILIGLSIVLNCAAIVGAAHRGAGSSSFVGQ